MKCLQKTCQRNKKIKLQSGYRSFCDEVAKDTTDKVKEKEASKDSIKTVKVEFNEMVKMHDKLSKGEINVS